MFEYQKNPEKEESISERAREMAVRARMITAFRSVVYEYGDIRRADIEDYFDIVEKLGINYENYPEAAADSLIELEALKDEVDLAERALEEGIVFKEELPSELRTALENMHPSKYFRKERGGYVPNRENLRKFYDRWANYKYYDIG